MLSNYCSFVTSFGKIRRPMLIIFWYKTIKCWMFRCLCLIWFGSFFYRHIKFRGLFNVKTIRVEEQLGYYSTHSSRDNWAHAFSTDISPKVNTIVQLDFELDFYAVPIMYITQRVAPYSIRSFGVGCFGTLFGNGTMVLGLVDQF